MKSRTPPRSMTIINCDSSLPSPPLSPSQSSSLASSRSSSLSLDTALQLDLDRHTTTRQQQQYSDNIRSACTENNSLIAAAATTTATATPTNNKQQQSSIPMSQEELSSSRKSSLSSYISASFASFKSLLSSPVSSSANHHHHHNTHNTTTDNNIKLPLHKRFAYYTIENMCLLLLVLFLLLLVLCQLFNNCLWPMSPVLLSQARGNSFVAASATSAPLTAPHSNSNLLRLDSGDLIVDPVNDDAIIIKHGQNLLSDMTLATGSRQKQQTADEQQQQQETTNYLGGSSSNVNLLPTAAVLDHNLHHHNHNNQINYYKQQHIPHRNPDEHQQQTRPHRHLSATLGAAYLNTAHNHHSNHHNPANNNHHHHQQPTTTTIDNNNNDSNNNKETIVYPRNQLVQRSIPTPMLNSSNSVLQFLSEFNNNNQRQQYPAYPLTADNTEQLALSNDKPISAGASDFIPPLRQSSENSAENEDPNNNVASSFEQHHQLDNYPIVGGQESAASWNIQSPPTLAPDPSISSPIQLDEQQQQQQQQTNSNQEQYIEPMSDQHSLKYDVAQVVCPVLETGPMQGLDRFACPSKDTAGYKCIMDHEICDGYYDCPGREDEDRKLCMFYKATKSHLDILADTLLRWARKGNDE